MTRHDFGVRRVALATLLVALACSDGASVPPRSTRMDCGAPRAKRVCTHLSTLVPPTPLVGIDVTVGANAGTIFGPMFERSDGLYVPLTSVVNNGLPIRLARLITNGSAPVSSDLQLPLADGTGEAFAASATSVAELAFPYEAPHFRLYGSSMTVVVDDKLADHGDTPDVAAHADRFAAAWSDQDGKPTFALFDAAGKRLSGPDRGGFGTDAPGEGAIVDTGCGFALLGWFDGHGTNVRFAAPNESAPTFDVGSGQLLAAAAWPYDASSVVWLGDDSLVKVVSDSGTVTTLGSSGTPFPTSFGLVLLSYDITDPAGPLRANVIAADGTVTATASWNIGQVTWPTIVAGETTDGLVVAWVSDAPEADALLLACDN